MSKLETLRQQIRQKFGSIHNFCKLHQNLKRATVYLVFAEKYAGNTQRQLAIIEKAYNSSEHGSFETIQTITEQEITSILQETKCSHCRLLHPNCSDCKRKNNLEARAVYVFIQARL